MELSFFKGEPVQRVRKEYTGTDVLGRDTYTTVTTSFEALFSNPKETKAYDVDGVTLTADMTIIIDEPADLREDDQFIVKGVKYTVLGITSPQTQIVDAFIPTSTYVDLRRVK